MTDAYDAPPADEIAAEETVPEPGRVAGPATEPAAGSQSESPADPARKRGHAWRVLAVTVLVVALLASSGLAAYLWLVSSRWIDQNETLRSEATDMGAELADAREQVSSLESEVETLQTQLDTTSSRLSDVVNDEAHAGDDLQYLGDLIDAYADCVDSYDEVLTDALTSGYTYTNSNARSVQADVADYCDSLAAAYEEYTAGGE
ncbi:hypothetical protein [Demequina salsinemoris]|uniref:hypothetical protein n=1 Tax=Demequina salsinemoris TaxID=577470 RepID=UPI0007821D33|nr:hypothetical protein [Demequina salsinemoris]